jgi:3-phenylpropionate/cinnamic acid dioxygenase small subunit
MAHPIETLIYREAQLLDEGKLDDWLDLYADDATYWLPMDENADPLKDSSIMFDNRSRLQMRVEQIMRQSRVAQTPASHMTRMVTNLVIDQPSENSATANFVMLLNELRSGDWRQTGLGETRQLSGRCTANFVRHDGQWKFQHKKIVLINRKQPIAGLSYLV